MPNLTAALEPAPLTTVENLRALRGASDQGFDGYDPASDDPRMRAAIDEVSAEFCAFLGMHLAIALRDEVYEVRKFSKLISLDGVALDPNVSIIVQMGGSPKEARDAQALDPDYEYVTNHRVGTVRLRVAQPYSPGYVRVRYAGGVVETTEAGGALVHVGMLPGYEWLRAAAEKQIIYRLQRRDTLGGNVSLGGAGTSFATQAYAMLPEVKRTLIAHRRARV